MSMALVVEHASLNCSAPGCKYVSKWKANVRRHEKQHANIDAPCQVDLSASNKGTALHACLA